MLLRFKGGGDLKDKIWLILFVGTALNAQSINIENFYYRDFLDFGQNKGSFASGNSTLTGKDGTNLTIPNVPNFQASSNYGSLTSIGRGFAVTANHVTSPFEINELLQWGTTQYKVAKESKSISQPYGRDEKFTRFTKYVVEGQVGMLDIENSTTQSDTSKESQNLQNFKDTVNKLADDEGNIYIYQAGSGYLNFRWTNNPQDNINLPQDGSMKGGGFGKLNVDSAAYYDLVKDSGAPIGDSRGIFFYYTPSGDFNNRITTGDSGSGIYAFDKDKQEWILVGVTSRATQNSNQAEISFVSNKDFSEYQKQFEQKIDLQNQSWTLEKPLGASMQFKQGNSETILQGNKDLIFSNGGTVTVKNNIELNTSNQTGGFVFLASNSATADNPTKYTFSNDTANKTYLFKGSGLDIGENVKVEWHLGNESGDSLHKIGKGTLIVKTDHTPETNKNLGFLKLGEGKVVLDTSKKAFEGIYITSGRASVELKQAEAIGATQNAARIDTQTLNKSYTLAQNKSTDMGFYFGTGGGVFDLSGHSLKLNTIAANDNKAIVTNLSTTLATLEIEGFGYENETKTTQKADTIIHASIGESKNKANLNLLSKSDAKTEAHLIFDGNIYTKGELQSENSNIVLQGHPTAHATVSDSSIIDKIINAENGTQKAMPDYMDLTKPSSLNQPDWDRRDFIFEKGIDLKNSSLTVGKAANLEANISADKTSIINFGGKHFIDEKDTKNITGSGFAFYQLVQSGNLSEDENYKDSSYSGTITADGSSISSKFMNFAPNLDLKNKANVKATYLTVSNLSSIKLNDSTAEIDNLVLKELSNFDKIKLENNAKFEVKESFIFDKSTFNLDTLQSNLLTMPTNYNLAAFNQSTITATTDFKNDKENAEFYLDDSNFSAKNVNFKSANMLLQNNAHFNSEKLEFSQNARLILSDKAEMNLSSFTLNSQALIVLDKESKLTLTNTLQGKDMNLSLDNASAFTTNSDLSVSDFSLILQNKSSFTANKLSTQGRVNILSDENSSLTLDTLELQNGEAKLNAKATIKNLNLTSIKEAFIGSNATLTNLNLTQSTAEIENLADNAKIDLKNNSTLYFNGTVSSQNFTLTNSNLHLDSLNLNSNFTLTGDETSKTMLKKLSYDAFNSTKQIPQSNVTVSELFELKNVGANFGQNSANTTLNAQDESLKKDLLALEFKKELNLQGTKLDISFSDSLKAENEQLQFDEFYSIFNALKLTHNDVNIAFNFASENKLFAEGKFENNAFWVKFRKDDPKNFTNLNKHIDPQYSKLLEILLEHDRNDESINKATNTSNYAALNTRLAGLEKSFENLAGADNGVLKTLPLLFKQEINARIQQNRFTKAKFAFNDTVAKSDFLPTLLQFVEDERKNRAWSNVGASYFTHKDSKFTLQSISLGYDRKLLNNEFLLGIMASFTQSQLDSDAINLDPQIYTVALYSDALLKKGELQSELSFSLLNGDKSFENANGEYKSFHSFFETVYKMDYFTHFKPLVLARLNLSSVDDFQTPTYKQKGADDISFDLGLGLEWLFEKEDGFYSATFMAQRDIFHSQKTVALSLANAQNFITYKTNEPSFSYQLYLSGLENFSNGVFLRYGVSAYIDSKNYKGVKGDLQLGYKF